METTIKQMCVVAAVLVLGAVAAQAAIINTYDGTETSTQDVTSLNYYAVQWFTVPAGTTATKVEMYASTTGTVGGECYFLLYTNANVMCGWTTTKLADFGGNPKWISSGFLPGWEAGLTSGSYYAQLSANTEEFGSTLSVVLVNPSIYSGGYAAKGSGGGTALGDNQDFWARVTVESVPEPATGLILLGGLGLVLRRRSVKR